MKSQKGFTLIEVMVSVGVFSVVVLVATVLTNWAISRFLSVKDRLVAESLSYHAEVVFRDMFSRAIDIEFDNGAVIAGMAGRTGRIFHTAVLGNRANFVFDQMAASAPWTNIALFYRENSPGQGALADRGQAIPTAVFYRAPTPTTSGVVFFDLATVEGLNTAMTPTYSDSYIDRVTLFSITKNRHPNYNKVTSINVRLSIRYHTNFTRGTTWCPALDVTAGAMGCNLNSAWRDLDRNFSISLSNNLMKLANDLTFSAVASEERTFANLYFFKMLIPLRFQ